MRPARKTKKHSKHKQYREKDPKIVNSDNKTKVALRSEQRKNRTSTF